MERVELISGLGPEEAAALAYFAVGVSSEGSFRGRNVAYRLSFAGTGRNGERLDPQGNSGFSIGTLQTDLGQHPAAAGDLVAAYRAWSAEQTAPQPIEADDHQAWVELERMLARNGRAIVREGGRNLAPDVREGLDRFLASEPGIDFVHQRDVAQVEYLLRPATPGSPSALHSIAGTELFRNASSDDQARLAAIFLKLENQSGRSIYPGLVQRITRGELEDLAAIKNVIDARKNYLSTGMHHTLDGVEAYLQLRDISLESPFAEAAGKVLGQPLVRPTSLGRTGDETSPSRAEYHAIKTMFLQPAPAVAFLQALDQGRGFAYGRVDRGQSGYFVSGDDFAYWDGDGQGHAGIRSAWREVTRDDMRRVNRPEGRVDLLERTARGEEALLQIDRAAPPLRPRSGPLEPESGAMLDQALHERIQAAHRATGVHADAVRLDRVTASLMRSVAAEGLQRVHHIAAHDGRLIAWDGNPRDPSTRWCSVSMEAAANTPVQASLAALGGSPGRERLLPDHRASIPLANQPATHLPPAPSINHG